jgi:hypothetical protein
MKPALEDALLEVLVRRMDNATTGAPMVDWATQALVEGLDAEALVYLAGMPRDCSVFEAAALLDKALAELGVGLPEAAELRRAYVGAVSRALLARQIGIEPALERIHQSAVGPLDHPPDLAAWCYAWEGLDAHDYHTLSGSEAEAETRRLADEWATYRAFAGSAGEDSGGGGA